MVLPHSKHIIDHLRTRGNATAFRDHEQSLTFQRLAGRALAIADSLILSGLPLSSPVAIALSPGSLAEFVAVTAVLASGNVVVPLFGQAEQQGERNVLRKPSRCGAVIYTATDRGLGQTFDALVARIEVDDDAFVVASFDGANNCHPEPNGTLCRSENNNQKIQIGTEAVNQLGSWLGEQLQLRSTSSLFVPLPLSAELRWFAIYASLAVGCCLVGGDPRLKAGSTATGSNTSPNPDMVCTTREAALAAQTTYAAADTPLPTTGCLIQQANDTNTDHLAGGAFCNVVVALGKPWRLCRRSAERKQGSGNIDTRAAKGSSLQQGDGRGMASLPWRSMGKGAGSF